MSKWPWPERLKRIVRSSPASSAARAVSSAPWIACDDSGAGMIPSLPANEHRRGEDVVLEVGLRADQPVADELRERAARRRGSAGRRRGSAPGRSRGRACASGRAASACPCRRSRRRRGRASASGRRPARRRGSRSRGRRSSRAGTGTRARRSSSRRRRSRSTTSGNAPASSICAIASWPITVWCSSTWLSTLPSEYAVSSRVAASSTASEIAIPRLPGRVGVLGEDRAPGVRLLGRARDDRRAPRLDHRAPERLLVVRDANHVDLALEPEQLAGERERAAPLAGAGLGREARAALALVVEGLRDGGVRLVAAGGADALVLVEDPRARPDRRARAGARGRAASGARGCRGRAPPPGSRSRAPRSPPGGSAPSGRAAPGRPARPAAPCPDAGSAASGSACRRGRCTSASGARTPRAGTSSAPCAAEHKPRRPGLGYPRCARRGVRAV